MVVQAITHISMMVLQTSTQVWSARRKVCWPEHSINIQFDASPNNTVITARQNNHFSSIHIGLSHKSQPPLLLVDVLLNYSAHGHPCYNIIIQRAQRETVLCGLVNKTNENKVI